LSIANIKHCLIKTNVSALGSLQERGESEGAPSMGYRVAGGLKKIEIPWIYDLLKEDRGGSVRLVTIRKEE